MNKTVTSNRGFSLTELIVVMAIFIVIIMLTSDAFENIYKLSRQHEKLAESNIEGVVGLELVRADISHAGFGLPWEFTPGFALNTEADIVANWRAPGINPNDYNDLPNPPRGMVVGAATSYVNGTAGAGPDYLVIKSTMAATNAAARRWSFLVFTSVGGANQSYVKPWEANNLDKADNVIAIRNTFSVTGAPRRTLLQNGGAFSFTIPDRIYPTTTSVKPPSDAFMPADKSEQVSIYGLNSAAATRFPFNRTDYFIYRPVTPGNFPDNCNLGTGVLYKGVISQTNGGYGQELPLMNCVGDMRVIYQLDMNDDGTAGTFVQASRADGKVHMGTEGPLDAEVEATLANANLLRSRLKEVRVYILAQEGQFDRNYTYPVADPNEALIVGEDAIRNVSKIWKDTDLVTAFGANWRNYRWKVYRIAVKPSSLN